MSEDVYFITNWSTSMKVKYKTVHGDVVYQSHLPQHSPHMYVAHKLALNH
ncbi:unnamed protein product [Fusarium graminearum]|uniref:Chromosome 4, complete genome n=1 Tax=Gibberella zeae (strain ATCC MYA-4620 / CBS 123657 / FGSC 9075 / NRRL 31084 / PH-1) TaxID=229533 RepID=A0A098DTZ1_GIBZE|nr:unnamed protein product [Fusarium graminearum]